MMPGPDFGPPFSLDWSGIPPHMSALDSVLWQRFRLRFSLPFDRVFYDVAVGRGAAPGGDHPENILAAWERITRQRIDVVGEQPSGWTIIELRAAAGPGALGSLITYEHLWAADAPDERPVALWLITDVFAENLRDALTANDIRLFLV